MTTAKGRELARVLQKGIEANPDKEYSWFDLEETCSLICRHAVTHHRLQEEVCNGPGDYVDRLPVEVAERAYARHDERVEREEARIEKRITELVGDLPSTPDGPFRVHFQGDPRGATVKLLVDNLERHPLYNGFASEAIIVPT